MNANKQRIAIAETVGWKWSPHPKVSHPDKLKWWIHPDLVKMMVGSGVCGAPDGLLPDYLNDLNAAITLCDFLAERGWNCHLDNGLDKTWECIFTRGRTGNENSDEHYGPGNTMTAAICQAFLRTVGKWEDEPERMNEGGQ